MDRELNPTIVKKRRRKKIVIITLVVLLLAVSLIAFRQLISTQISNDRIRTTKAEVGAITNTLSANGEVIPAFEQLITSPIRADIQELLVQIGDEVRTNQPLMELDKSFALLTYEKLKQELELKRNNMAKLRIKLEQNLFDLQINDSIKALKIEQLLAELDNSKRLAKIGGGTQEDIDKVKLDLSIAELEKRQLENNLKVQQKTTVTDLKELEIQANIQANAIREMEEKLKRAEIVASRPGVLTWLNENIGSSVNEGDPLARIADLRSYKVLGTCSDIYAERIRIGMPVTVRMSEEDQIDGSIANIRPTVENNVITFEVQLEENDHPMLRPNQKVELAIITHSKPNVVRVANGPAFSGQAQQKLFVVKNGKAEGREVKVGMSNYDFVEIETNIEPGEEIIISDMSRYAHLSSIKIKK